jgi:hypothetical protein
MASIYKKHDLAKKEKFLRVFGCSQGRIRNILVSKIIYHFFLMRDGNFCRRCGEEVNYGDHSLDHDSSFWDSKDAWEAYLNLDRCFLSHKSCNYKHGQKEKMRLLATKNKRAFHKKNILRGMYENERRDSEPTCRAKQSFERNLREAEPKKEKS